MRHLHELDHVDHATATLILQLQISDIEELQQSSKGKSRDDERSDADLAIATYQNELQKMNTIQADRSMARSLMQAILSDATLLNESVADENTATGDRALACRLAGIEASATAPEQSMAGPALDDGAIARLAARFSYGKIDEEEALEGGTANDAVVAESSASAASTLGPSRAVSRQCVVCDLQKPLIDVFQSPCGHNYCQMCLSTLIEHSTTDETLFPPRCCRQEMPLASVKIYLSPLLLQALNAKSVEYRASNRIYCSRRTCSSFITSDKIVGERAVCTACGTHTCTICKSIAHDGVCPEDTATQQVLETAQQEGWQRCYNCGRLVELDLGCNHMT